MFKSSKFLIVVIFFISCKDSSQSTFRDIDGNVYHTTQIGNQIWMVENLKTTHFRNGDPLNNIKDSITWVNNNNQAYCSYQNDTNYANQFGYLYNNYVITDARNIAPKGFHIPSIEEIDTLISFLNRNCIYENDSINFKLIGLTKLWNNCTFLDTNKFGFTALPSGYRNSEAIFSGLGKSMYLTSNSPGNVMIIECSRGILRTGYSRTGYSNNDPNNFLKEIMNQGVSVRCIKD